ncbi:hypothetical protein [Xanthomonas sacchari]|uniref:hypothetical protein n=1 Tax=Xanthomonas sacchari TaxID=56458 RepID=UPI00224D3D2F|nr:hypothetical protein [Xanthomonas sacchari]
MSSKLDKITSREERDERFFKALKDMNELLGSWTLGAAVLGAGYAVVSSDLAIILRLAGALACFTTGLMAIVSGVLLFSRHRLALADQTPLEKAIRTAKFVALMACALSVSYATMEILRKATESPGCSRSAPSNK